MGLTIFLGVAFLHVQSTTQADPLTVLFEEAAQEGLKRVVLETVAKRAAGVKDPRPCSEYDFVLDIPDVTSFQFGWPLNYANFTVLELLLKRQEAEPVSIVALLGCCGTGKSFVLNQLYNAEKRVPDPSWWSGLFGAQRQTRGRCVAESPDVSTRGISGVFTGFGTKLEEASTLLLDTAGRNAPALQPEQLNTQELKNRISVMRAKERMIDDIVTGIADTVVYVVDELLNEDRRTIMQLVETSDSDPRIVIIHNWKRIDCADTDTKKKMVQAQIIGPFAAVEEKPSNTQDDMFPGVRTWKSAWKFKASDLWQRDRTVLLTHTVLFDDKVGACSKINVGTFRMLNLRFMTHKRPDKLSESLLERVGRVAYTSLHKYVKEVQPTPADKRRRVTMEKQAKIPCDAKMKVEVGDVELQHVEWELRDMRELTKCGLEKKTVETSLEQTRQLLRSCEVSLANSEAQAESSSPYLPRSNMYEGRDGRLYIRVDLPGFKESDKWKPALEKPDTAHWFKVAVVDSKSGENHTYSIVVTGHRGKPSGFKDDDGTDAHHRGQCYGHFSLSFPIFGARFNKPKVEVEFEDAVLKIILESTHDEL
jgi:HSP20 family molecular chaperone IbpA